ncbi:MAG TPA: penicillin-binding protein [Ruminococcaceae bacterium]|nr:penicillin-binding protein [Oscillospiraceae bacterium]
MTAGYKGVVSVRKISSRSFMILIMTLAFFAGLVYYTVNLVMHTAEWVSVPSNTHLPAHDKLEYAGKILDRNNVVLAQSVEGQRYYNTDELTRKACVHIVGDNSVNIATAVQTVYRSKLTSFRFTGSFLFGLGMPESMKKIDDVTITGNDFRLTVDSRLQKVALQALGDYKGAIFFYNYKTGEILCMVSTPTYDPQNVPEDIETNDAYAGAYLNRALSASYPPGSTFKLVTANAALQTMPDITKSTYICPGTEIVGGSNVSCYQNEPHGLLDMKEALAKSCNIYFGKLAVALGRDRMTKTAEQMGFNQHIEFDGIETADSIYDVSTANDNELAWSGIGQYTVLETPVNMAMISGAIANGGTPVKPYFVDSINELSQNTPTLGERMLDKPTADTLREMMEYTALSYSNLDRHFRVCAKTGTAEISDDGTVAHAWLTGFLIDEECPLAFSVLLERVQTGSAEAIEAANKVLQAAAEYYHA